MPASRLMPVRSTHLSAGSTRIRAMAVNVHVVVRIPIGFPNTRAAIIAIVRGSLNAVVSQLIPPMATPAEKNGKLGAASPAEEGWERCASRGVSPRAALEVRAEVGSDA